MKELELSLSRFEQANVKVNGFILNDIQRAGAGYGIWIQLFICLQSK
jgi:tyrosine-protein kinase Etk/Wzc